VGQAVAAAQQLGKRLLTQPNSRKMQNESVFVSASGSQGSTPAVSDRQVYIVRFKQYRMLSDLWELLTTVSSTRTSTGRIVYQLDSPKDSGDSNTCKVASRHSGMGGVEIREAGCCVPCCKCGAKGCVVYCCSSAVLAACRD
jgi:hypothetical protein